MKRLLSTLVSLVSVVWVVGCAGGPSSSAGPASFVLAEVDDIATGPLQTRPAVVELNGKPGILYSTKAGRVAFQNGDKRSLLDETARVKQGGSYFQLNKQGQNLQALWWSHQDGKNVYLASSTDGGQSFAPVSMVNDEHGVLPPFTLTHAEDGVLGVTYHDERVPNYQAFFNRSTDYGRTWARPDMRLDTPPEGGRSSNVHEPQMVQVGKVWVSAWTDTTRTTDGQASYRIVSRRSLDAGKTWMPAEVLFASNHHISALIVRAQDGHIVLAADELNRGVFALTSSDQGATWAGPGILAGTDGVNNSGIDMAIADGRVHLVWMRDRSDEKTRIMRGSFDIAAAKWLDSVQRLNPKEFENTRSTSPVILANAQGKLIAAWVDYMDIRPNIYLSTSHDRGQSWTSPQALLNPGEVAAGWPMLIRWEGDVAIGYETYPTDVLANGRFQIRMLKFAADGKELIGLPNRSQISESAKKARLEERVKALWESRIASNYEPAYDIFDFAYKAATPKKSYLENTGVITYMSYSVDSIAISGNEASVNMKVKYEVKPTILPMTGKPITVPPFDAETPTKWVWVANDWYLVYTPSFDPPVLKY